MAEWHSGNLEVDQQNIWLDGTRQASIQDAYTKETWNPGERWNLGVSVRGRMLRVVTLLERPFVFARNPADDGHCWVGHPCLDPRTNSTVVLDRLFKELKEENGTLLLSGTLKCCYGFCVDLLENLARDLGFQFQLYLVADGKYGVLRDGRWTGLVGDLQAGVADLALGSFSITSARSEAVDFTRPFFSTSLAIMVRGRDTSAPTGAVLYPLHWSVWVGVVIALHLTAILLALYEWRSRDTVTPDPRRPPGRALSYSSALSICHALLFGRPGVRRRNPTCWMGRSLVNLWAGFCLLVISGYTANLTAIAVGGKIFDEVSGILDLKVQTSHRTKVCGLQFKSCHKVVIGISLKF